MLFTFEEVHNFVLNKGWLRQEHADKLLTNKVDGATLLQSSAKDISTVYGLPGGPAVKLVVELGKMIPDEGWVLV